MDDVAYTEQRMSISLFLSNEPFERTISLTPFVQRLVGVLQRDLMHISQKRKPRRTRREIDSVVPKCEEPTAEKSQCYNSSNRLGVE